MAVVGAGAAGLTAAALLAKEGRVEVRSRRDKQVLKVTPEEVVGSVRELARRLAAEP